MFEFPFLFLRCLLAGVQSQSGLVLENLALRHQLAMLKRQARKPKPRTADRLLWVGLRGLWPHWQQALLLFQPQTIVAWHRLGFRLFWRWKARTRAGRPSVDGELIALIQKMWQSNPTWGSEQHLRQVLSDYLTYYPQDRSHRALDQDCPVSRPVEPPDQGHIIVLPRLGGLHHRYTRQAA